MAGSVPIDANVVKPSSSSNLRRRRRWYVVLLAFIFFCVFSTYVFFQSRVVSSILRRDQAVLATSSSAFMDSFAWQQQEEGTSTMLDFDELAESTPTELECAHNSGFDFRSFEDIGPWKYMALPEAFDSPSGFQRRCDWVIGSRQVRFRNLPLNASWGNPTIQPRTVFVLPDRLQAFYYRLLPCISSPFVLLVGDADSTTPRQTDIRFGKLLDKGIWEAIMEDPRVIHVFIEHLDHLDERYHKISALPTGLNAKEYRKSGGDGDTVLSYVQEHAIPDLVDRPLTMLQIDRRRNGPQWLDREYVHYICANEWVDFCHPDSSPPGKPFFDLLQKHSFVLCVHGGGQDPNPKAWEALLAGSIPIIKHFPGYEIYRGLPVVVLDAWTPEMIDEGKLASWREQLAPYYTNPILRTEVLRRLTSEFWWSKVRAAFEGHLDAFTKNVTQMSIAWRDYPNLEDSLVGLQKMRRWSKKNREIVMTEAQGEQEEGEREGEETRLVEN